MTEIKKDKHVRKLDMAALWADAMSDADFRFEQKAQKVAVDLVKMVAQSNFSQAELAEKLGWKASRVSKVLHGATNMTLKTLCVITEALDMDFDVIFRSSSCNVQAQNWENRNQLLQRIKDMHVESEKNLNQSRANLDKTQDCLDESHVILQTVKDINRRTWQASRATRETYNHSMSVHSNDKKFAQCN